MSALLRRALGGCVVLAVATHGAYAQAQDDAATFEARAVAAPERGAGAASLDADDARASAGAAGEPALALANLPGVARAGLASGELVIWGSPPADTRVYVDGIELPAFFHPGGFRTTIHPALLSRLTLTPGAPGPALGGGLGGVVELETRDLDIEGSHAAVDVTTMDSAALLHASLGPARAAWGVRVGYFDRLEPLLAPRSTAIVPLPAYADGIAKAEVDLGRRAQLTALWLGSHDRVVRGIEAVDPGSSRTQTQSRDLQLGYLRYSRAFDDGARIVLTPFVATHAHAETDRNGSVPWDLDVRELRYGLRAGYAMLTQAFDVRLGVDSSAVRSEIGRTGSLTLPPREGDVVVFGQPPGSGVSSDHFTTYDANVAPHAELTARFGRFVLSPGFRLDVHALSSSRARPTVASTPPIGFSDLQARPEPRVGLRYLVNDWLSGDARAGLTHQVAAPEDRSAVFGNPALGLARAWTLAAGPRARLLALVDVEATAFYKTLARLPARNPTQPVPLAQGLLARGTGDAYGAELLVRLRAWHGLSGQLGYTLSRAERRDIDAPTRLFDFDQTHVLSVLAAYAAAGFIVSGRARLASGSPRTPVVGEYRDLADDRFEPVFGAHNGIRLPAFFALDLRIERVFVQRAFSWSIALDVSNVTNRRNVEDIAYRFDYRAREDIIGLPTLAVLGWSLRL